MSHASRAAHVADLIDDLADLYLAQVADLREFAQTTEAGEVTLHLEQALRQREIRRADLYRQFEPAAFSPAPIPLVAPTSSISPRIIDVLLLPVRLRQLLGPSRANVSPI
ncbi:MAG: hypothetical protein QOH35_2080 [Acidobacteriaceae bacterium]|jgi:hypothetical protein|nr:hypothetical protein [Acidobacteriaceae bacterium]MEA2262054.1 hypothetical protein [Acidobacteriaceae bacterium]MEA2540714.1 hypothetical protein [Acidobacteriaceae bacterium]